MKKIITGKSHVSIREEGIGIIILLCAMISSSIYALYLEQKDVQSFRVLYNWILQKSNKNITFEYVFCTYLKRLCLIWGVGWIGGILPVGLLFCVMFAYGFTNASLIMIFGLKGAGLAFLYYGIQGIMMLSLGILIIQKSQNMIRENSRQSKKEYLLLLIPMIASMAVMSLADMSVGIYI